MLYTVLHKSAARLRLTARRFEGSNHDQHGRDDVGAYRVVALIGRGGMGTVYKAFHEATDRYVAVKVLPAEFSDKPELVARFEREARVVASLQHIHILPVFDFGQQDGLLYLVMPYITGGTLYDYMVQHERLALDDAARLFCQVAEAVDYAHQQGVLHRDIKPVNVLIDDSGNTLLSDFGLTRLMEAASRLTGTGVTMGTPAYMSPEQGRGEQADPRSDIYSLGVVLYELVTGEVPFTAETPVGVVFKHISAPVPPAREKRSDVPEAVESVINKALAKDPDDRYQTAGELAAALRQSVMSELAASDETITEPAVHHLPKPTTQELRRAAPEELELTLEEIESATWIEDDLDSIRLTGVSDSPPPKRKREEVTPLPLITEARATPLPVEAKGRGLLEGTPKAVYQPGVMWQLVRVIPGLVIGGFGGFMLWMGAMMFMAETSRLDEYLEQGMWIPLVMGIFPALIGYAIAKPWIDVYNMRVLVYADGLKRVKGREISGQVAEIYWDDIKTVRQKAIPGRSEGGRMRECTIETVDGSEIRFKDSLKNIDELGRTIQQEVTARLLPDAIEAYNAGESLDFGVFGLSVEGLRLDDTVLPWPEIGSVNILSGNVYIRRRGQQQPWAVVRGGGATNLYVFVSLVNRVLEAGQH